MKFSFSEPTLPKSGTIAVLVWTERKFGLAGHDLNQRTGDSLTRAMIAARFVGKKDETLALLAPAGLPEGNEVDRILLVGMGKIAECGELAAQAAGGAIVAALEKSGCVEASVLVDVPDGLPLTAGTLAAEIAFGGRLRAYRFDKYRTTEKKDQKPTLKKVHLLTGETTAARKTFTRLDKVADGVLLTRDLVSEPANNVNPATLAERCKSLGTLGLEVDVLDEKRLRKMGMGALVGVGQGSAVPPCVVVLKYDGHPGGSDKRPVVFVGKGVTFDSGGICIKPGGGMEDMKWDMAGAGAVIGVMAALAGRKAKVNAVGVVGLAENMPSGNAQRPGDVVTSMSGQTIEVINTDAEGRLVLADALWYAQDTFKPRYMIDLATLTGAVGVALGSEYAGLFANDDALADQLTLAGKTVGEPLWRLPLGEAYDKDINSDIADMKNVGTSRNAGSIIGAQFLKRFVNEVPWAHLDIAAVTWSKKDTATVPKGGTAFGVRLLDRFVADVCEE